MTGKEKRTSPPYINNASDLVVNGMKTIYIVGGAMGVGKTTVCQRLKTTLQNSVFLDGDWCWDAHPFQVTEETKRMVLQNICFLLNQFIRCSAYDHIIFCWVLHEQTILDAILAGVDSAGCRVKNISLLCDEACLRERLRGDISRGLRTEDVVARSVSRLPCYSRLATDKIDTSRKTVGEVVQEILRL